MSKIPRMRFVIGLAAVLSLAGTAWIASSSTVAQSTISGEWKASLDKDNSKIHLSLERRSEKNGRNQMGQTYSFDELQGLSREQALNGGPVRFSLVREAGRIDCEGSFQNGRGSGTFRFTANQSFVSAMKSRGFDFEDDSNDDRHPEDRLFAATVLNVTTALADDLASAGFGKLGVEDLFKAAIFKIDSTFMREMKASGFDNLGMEELVKARIFKIDGEFIRQAKAAGVPLEVERLVQRRIGFGRN